MKPLDEILKVCPDAYLNQFTGVVLCKKDSSKYTQIACTEKCRSEKLKEVKK